MRRPLPLELGFRALPRLLIFSFLIGLLAVVPAMGSDPEETGMQPSDPQRPTNRLSGSTSPYLLLHQFNPVDWYPWGPEALQRAREEDKPIFLSVGYSSCYWCHVMERESFDDPETAALMNREFINIKVDREERPDLDEIYMAATQIMTGQGGWPNSVFLTPDLQPFFTGTYFPPQDRHGRPGFPTVLLGVARAWKSQRAQVIRSAEAVAERMAAYLQAEAAPGELPGRGPAIRSLEDLSLRFDSEWGGFGGAPKFPTPSNLFLLLEAATADSVAAEMLQTTLDEMARGGIYDQVGGGFHRYATDREWKIPHFEKMLYDNGLLLEIYARTYEIDPDPEWRRIAKETVDFLDREMLDPGGAYWSAIDAETDAHEGAFYVWTRDEIDRALGGDDAVDLASILGFSGAPFFEGTHYVLHFPVPLEELAAARQTTRRKLLERIDPLRAALLAARGSRERPLTDDKILADWNGLVIAGLATAGRVFEAPAMVERAEAAARFVLEALWRKDSTGVRQLQHAYRDGRSHIPAFLSDYSYLVHGLLALHEATGNPEWLALAEELVAEQGQRLGRPDGGYFVAAESDDVLFRSLDPYDGAVPSANGIAVWNLLELAARFDGEAEARYRADAERSLRSFSALLQRLPGALRSLSIGAVRNAGGWPEDREAQGEGELPGAGAPTTPSQMVAAEAAGLVSSRLEAVPTEAGRFRLTLDIAEGWHVQANPASLEFLIPTAITGKNGEPLDVVYPEGERYRFAFADDEVSVYQGRVVLEGALATTEALRHMTLTFQACNHDRCLPPVARELVLE